MTRKEPKVVRAVAELRQAIAAWRREGLTVALVPTRGALHLGHLALHRLAPLAQGVDLRRAVQHPAHGAELLQRGLGPGDQSLQGDGDVRSAGIDGNDGVVRFAAAFQEGDHVVLRGGGAVNDEKSRADEGGSATDVPVGARAYMKKEGLVEEGRKVVIG